MDTELNLSKKRVLKWRSGEGFCTEGDKRDRVCTERHIRERFREMNRKSHVHLRRARQCP